jgi:hypothetical protein
LRNCADKINTIRVKISAGHFECISYAFAVSVPAWTALSVLTAATDRPNDSALPDRGVPDAADEDISLRPASQGQHNSNLSCTIMP